MFTALYDRVLSWSRHPKAPAFLGTLSFAESSFFPIPPDVMLAPMCLARPRRSFWYATLTTVTSVLGGLVGYLIGRLAFSSIEGWLLASAYAPAFEQAVASFDRYGFWYVLLWALFGFIFVSNPVFVVLDWNTGLWCIKLVPDPRQLR